MNIKVFKSYKSNIDLGKLIAMGSYKLWEALANNDKEVMQPFTIFL